MKTSQDFQKISAVVSLFIHALGFSSIGLTSLIHQRLSGDSPAFSGLSCVIGGWASVAVASVSFSPRFSTCAATLGSQSRVLTQIR
jgi:hypothetical protein